MDKPCYKFSTREDSDSLLSFSMSVTKLAGLGMALSEVVLVFVQDSRAIFFTGKG